MKIILKTIVLSLLLSGNAYAKENMKDMIENCADYRFMTQTRVNDFEPKLYSSKPKFQELEKEMNSLKEKKNVLNSQFKKEVMKKDGSENLKLNTDQFVLSNKDFAKRLVEVEDQMLSFIRLQALNFIKSEEFKLRSKIKIIDGYFQYYMYCEEKSQGTPISFKLKWSD